MDISSTHALALGKPVAVLVLSYSHFIVYVPAASCKSPLDAQSAAPVIEVFSIPSTRNASLSVVSESIFQLNLIVESASSVIVLSM